MVSNLITDHTINLTLTVHIHLLGKMSLTCLLHKYAFSYIYIRTLETYRAAATSAPPVIFKTYTI